MVAPTKSRSKPVTRKSPRSKPRASARAVREPRAAYRASRWKIPNITPIGSDEPVSKTLPQAVKRIAETLHPEKIILFGSYAYGNPTPDSDVDLLVVMNSYASEKERYLAVCRLLRPRPFAVDILVRTPQEVDAALHEDDFFIHEIATQGRLLYERQRQTT